MRNGAWLDTAPGEPEDCPDRALELAIATGQEALFEWGSPGVRFRVKDIIEKCGKRDVLEARVEELTDQLAHNGRLRGIDFGGMERESPDSFTEAA